MRALERAWRAGKSEWRSHITSALGTAVAFLCLTFALISSVNLNALKDRWEHSGRISVYLALSATETQVAELRAALNDSAGVDKAEFMSSERAREELLGGVSTTLLETLPVEAFPPSIEVKLTAQAAAERGRTIAQALSQMAAVESVETYDNWAARIGELVQAASIVVLVLAGIVFLAVVAVVASTTQLALQRRREEVEVLRFVGATRAYVRAPFLLEGAAQGALGATLALCFAAITFATLREVFAEQLVILLGALPTFLPWFLCCALIVVGAVLGSSAAYLSLRSSFSS